MGKGGGVNVQVDLTESEQVPLRKQLDVPS